MPKVLSYEGKHSKGQIESLLSQQQSFIRLQVGNHLSPGSADSSANRGGPESTHFKLHMNKNIPVSKYKNRLSLRKQLCN